MRTDKYLTELGVPKEQQWLENSYYPWYLRLKQKIKIWLDRRKHMVAYVDTYNFDDTMCKYLYAGLRRYVDVSEKYIILDDKTCLFEWQSKEYTQLEMIKMILERLETYYTLDEFLPDMPSNATLGSLPQGFFDEYNQKEKEALDGVKEAWEMWAIIWKTCWN